ncbi:MAG TPA: protein kinase [Pyrinomonadaceae bacterium]|nr:protein kinase [Pyrinomonadaceae bacterium]
MLHCPECGLIYADGASVCPADGAALRADVTAENPSPADKLIGQVLDGKYRLDAVLGEGGMGTVYRATHLLIDRPVAVKVLRPHFVEDAAAQQRFRREARAAGRLRHPNAVAVTDFGDTPEGYVYIVMELLEGRTLREMIAAEGPLPAARGVSLMEQAAAAVAAAHEAGVIHRDLKPGNIFVVQGEGARPVVKVLDFGIAKLAADSSEDSGAKNLTQTGVMIGTPRYMSPEQCDGEKLTPASDVYSLGVILYEMLTGAPPFNGPTPLAVALQHSSKPPRPPRELVPAIPEELERVVLRALAKSPAGRPANAGEFRRELLETQHSLDTSVVGDARDTPALVVAGAALGDGNGRSVVTPSGRFVIGLDRGRDEAADGGDGNGRDERDDHLVNPAARVGPNDTTIVSNTSERARVAAASLGNAPAPPGSAIDRLFPLQGRAYTRFQVLLKRRGWPQRLAQPPVLIAALLALVVLSIVTVGLIRSRGAGVGQPAAVENANANPATPTPTPEETPTPSPTPAASNRQRNQRAGRAAANRRQQQRRAGDNPVKKVLKKIFKPF